MKFAVVGTGISGLAVARRLHERGDEVVVYEARDRIGGHTATVDVEVEGQAYSVDTGFIVFNEATYPRFCALLRELGVAWTDSDMSFAVRVEGDGIEYGATSLASLFAQRSNLVRPRFWGMLRDLLRFYREAPALLEDGGSEDSLTLGEYLEQNGYSQTFIDWHLVPMVCAVWSGVPARMMEFPVRTLVRFFANHGFLEVSTRPQWLTIPGGSRKYATALAAPLVGRIRLGTPVRSVLRSPLGVVVRTDAGDESFDEVVLACHSDQALAILQEPTPAEREVLGAMRYQRNEVVLHTDAAVMPRRKRAWASWNVQVPDDAAARDEPVRVTYWMNKLQPLAGPHDLFVTLNRTDEVDSGRVLRSFVYHHPIFDAAAVRARQRHAEIDGAQGVRFCGAYWGNGFHEDGLASADAVLERIDARKAVSA